MITLAVAAVVLTLGVPSFSSVIERNRLTAHINELVSTLNYARSEAVKRNSDVTVCQSADGLNCGGLGYEDGWIIFIDLNADGDYADAGEELIRLNEGLPNNYTMRTNNLTSFTFNAKGRASNGRIVLCKDNAINQARAIVISNSGRTRLSPLDANGIPEIAPGNPMAECIPPWS